MRAFIGFETSSLGGNGYPIEVAWVLEDGRSENFLIRPLETWTEWNSATEANHGISREDLATHGTPAHIVGKRLVGALSGHEVVAGEPSCAGKWLSTLLHSAGLPRDAIGVSDMVAALLELAAAELAPVLTSSEIHRAARQVLADAAGRFAGRKPARRALGAAKLERERWLMVSELAHAFGKLA